MHPQKCPPPGTGPDSEVCTPGGPDEPPQLAGQPGCVPATRRTLGCSVSSCCHHIPGPSGPLVQVSLLGEGFPPAALRATPGAAEAPDASLAACPVTTKASVHALQRLERPAPPSVASLSLSLLG